LSAADQDVLARASRRLDEVRRGLPAAAPTPAATEQLVGLDNKLDDQWNIGWRNCNDAKFALLRGTNETRWYQTALSFVGLLTAGMVPVLNTASTANIVWSSAMGATSGLAQGTLEATRRLGVDTLLSIRQYNGVVSKISLVVSDRVNALSKPLEERVVAKAALNMRLQDACENPPLQEPEGLTGVVLNELADKIRNIEKKVDQLAEKSDKEP
jgi:hypothetical protein